MICTNKQTNSQNHHQQKHIECTNTTGAEAMRHCSSHVVVIRELQEFRHTNKVKMNVGAVFHELSHEHKPDNCIEIARSK